MDIALKDRRILTARVGHDRRRQKVVEDLLDAMRARAYAAGRFQDRRVQGLQRVKASRRFWALLATIITALIIVAMVAKWANYSSDVRSQVLGAGAIYGWLGMHRVAPPSNS